MRINNLFWLSSTKYDAKREAVEVLPGSYVRDNYPGKVPLLPWAKSSKKRQEKEW
jgi:hypothetical protein